MFNGIAEKGVIQEAPVVLDVAAGVELVSKRFLKVVEDVQEAARVNIAVPGTDEGLTAPGRHGNY